MQSQIVSCDVGQAMRCEQIVRAILCIGRSVVLLRRVGTAFWYFPGGHIEPGEAPQIALARELAEELGLGRCRLSPRGVVPYHYFDDRRQRREELNHVFEAHVAPGLCLRSRERWSLLRLVARQRFAALDIRPRAIARLARRVATGGARVKPKKARPWRTRVNRR